MSAVLFIFTMVSNIWQSDEIGYPPYGINISNSSPYPDHSFIFIKRLIGVPANEYETCGVVMLFEQTVSRSARRLLRLRELAEQSMDSSNVTRAGMESRSVSVSSVISG